MSEGIPLDVWGFSDGEILPPSTTINDTSKIWKIVEFGEYPQTLKAENVTITSQTPDADGYYLGSDGARYAKQVAIGENDNTNRTKRFVANDENLNKWTFITILTESSASTPVYTSSE